MEFLNCPWCDQRNKSTDLECRKCGGPLPAPIGDDPGPNPPFPPRKIPSGYRWRMLVSNAVLNLVGGIFLLVGLPFAVIFPIVGIATGMLLFVLIGGGLGGVFTILGGGMLFFGIRDGLSKIRPFEHGLATVGEVVEMYRDHSISINGRNPMAIVYTYTVHGIEYEDQVHSWKYGKQTQAVGNRVHVLYLPDDPHQSVIYPPVT